MSLVTIEPAARRKEVEFVNPDGSTCALLTLAPDQMRKLQSTDVLTTRRVPPAA
jgi:hypothetical protein